MEDERHLMMAVLQHLETAAARPAPANRDALHAAMSAICDAYALDARNPATRERYPLDGLPLVDVFTAGRARLLDAAREPRRAPPAFHALLRKLRHTAFFDGAPPGSPAYARRVARAREMYDARVAQKRARGAPAGAGADAAAAKAGADAQGGRAEADALKEAGNERLKAGDFAGAHELYSRAIGVDGGNAVYLSNRAAASMRLGRFSEAVEDCREAIRLDGAFLRPRERLAAAYRQLGMAREEADALRGALGVAPESAGLGAQLRDAERRLAGGANGQAGRGVESVMGEFAANPGAIGDMARSMGVPLPEGAVESFVNSGGMEQFGSMLRENPGIMQQAMQAMMGGGGFPGMGGGGAPNGGGQG